MDGKGYANTTYISEFHPHIPKPSFRNFRFQYLCVFPRNLDPLNRVSPIVPEKCLTLFVERSVHEFGTILKYDALTFQSASI